jgi:DoxX-like family
MLHAFSVLLLVAAFFGGGVFNSIGAQATKSDYARWGHPGWWCFSTGGLETTTAVLIALPASRVVGLALGEVIIAAAVLTILRRCDFKHLAPLGIFVALLALAEISS